MGKNYTQLSIEERTMIQTQLSMGHKPGQIARALGRSAGTLSRELKRNEWTRPQRPRGIGRPSVTGGYRADIAQQRANACTTTPRVERRLRPGTALWKPVLRYLKAGSQFQFRFDPKRNTRAIEPESHATCLDRRLIDWKSFLRASLSLSAATLSLIAAAV